MWISQSVNMTRISAQAILRFFSVGIEAEEKKVKKMQCKVGVGRGDDDIILKVLKN